MATKKKATKKTAAKAKKSAKSKPPAKKASSRPADPVPPSGDLKKAFEAHIAASLKTLSERDRVKYSPGALLDDAAEILEDVAAAAALMKSEDAPVGVRAFDWLQLHVDALRELGVERRSDSVVVKTVSENAAAAMDDVLAARSRLALRAEACGLPTSGFDLSRSATSPRALYRAALDVVDVARRMSGDFDSKKAATRLIDALEEAAERLADVAGVRLDQVLLREKNNARRAVVVRSLYDTLLWLSRWGRAVGGEDPVWSRRFRLDKTFPSATQKVDVEDPLDVPTPAPEPAG